MSQVPDRYQRGLAVLNRIGGADGAAPLTALQDIAPDLPRLTIEFAYGDILARPGLDLKTRELTIVAALAAMGTAPPQLRYHINGALNVGCMPAEVVETVMLCAVYAGFPATINGVSAVREIIGQRGLAFKPQPATGSEDRYQRGLRVLERASGVAGSGVMQSLQDIAPDLGRFVIEFCYGDILGRETLDDRTRELAAVALLTALATAPGELQLHVGAALRAGASQVEIVEVIQQMMLYAGFPAALNGLTAARTVLLQQQPRA